MPPHYQAASSFIAIPSTNPPAFVRVYQAPARPLAALTLVPAEPRPKEHSGAYRGG